MMHLSHKEAVRFYDIWLPLLNYVNEQRQISSTFADAWQEHPINPTDAIQIRNALWEDDSLLEAFVNDNPANLSPADLSLVDSWQHRIVGDFFVFRYLKSHAVFLREDKKGYGVHGITASIEDTLLAPLPIYIKTVLIPFEGRIIYDSLFSLYRISFGGGIRKSLTNDYRLIQERGGVITTLPEPSKLLEKAVRKSNKKTLTAFTRHLGKSGLSPKKMEEHRDNIASFSDHYLVGLEAAVFLIDIEPQHLVDFDEAYQGKINWVSFKRFVRFLRDSGRIDWDHADELLDTVKRLRRPADSV